MKIFRSFIKGILLKGESSNPTDNKEGSIWHNSSDNKIKSYLGAAIRTLVSEDQTQTLTNKSIDADNNPISNVDTTNLRAGVLNLDMSGAATDTEIPSALAVKTALEAQNEADEITYDNATSGLTATDVQAAIDEVDGNVDTNTTAISDHLADAVDAHDASAISNVPAGNLAATDVQAALNELQGDIDTNATGLSDHLADAADAHDASAISNVPAGNLAATDVQAALNELQTELDDAATSTELNDHITDAVGAHAASAIANTPSGNLAATEVQAALNELQSDIDTRALDSDLTDHINDATGAHAASAIANTPSGNLTATNVQAALNELQTELDGAGGGATTELDNLGTTSINADLLPSSNIARNIGSASLAFNDMHIQNVLGREGTRIVARLSGEGNISAPTTNVAGALIAPHNTAGLRRFGIFSESDATADSSQTTDLLIETGNKTAGTGSSGDIALTIGTSAGGTQGDIKFLKAGVAPTVGHVWTCTNADGSGYYAAAAAAGATTELDNLGTTAINANLNPDSASTRSIGTAALPFLQIRSQVVNSVNGSIKIINGASSSLFNIQDGIAMPSGNSVMGITNGVASTFNALGMSTINNATADAVATGTMRIETGNKTAGTGDSGSIHLQPGTSVGGNQGDVIIDSNKLDASAVSEGVGLPVWKKVTVAHTALQTASTANDVELLSLPAAATIHAVIIKHSTAFAGTGITAYDVSIGIAGDLAKYASAFDILQATGDTVAQTTNVVDVENFGSATSIRIAATSTGANLDQSSAGSVDVYVLMSTLPV